MSQMIVRGHDGDEFKLNVTQFRSLMAAGINSVQTRKMMQHFPIRAGQPDIQFTVQFPSIDAKHEFQDFVREHQRNALDDKYSSSQASSGAIKLLWPERDIMNWTGYIVSMPIREVRFDYAPKVTFGVALVDSMLSERTFQGSLGNSFWNIVGTEISAYIPDPADVDSVIQPPTPPSSQTPQQEQEDTQNQNPLLFGNRFGPGRR